MAAWRGGEGLLLFDNIQAEDGLLYLRFNPEAF
jgi:hypothetical protein